MRDMDFTAKALADLLARYEQTGAPKVLSCRPLTGGYSRIMTHAVVAWPDGREQALVLRSDPPPEEIVYKTDRRSEWNVLRALTDAAAVAMPPALYFDDGSHLGAPTIVLGCCDGPSLQAASMDGDADLDSLAEQVADTLAGIHNVDLALLDGALTPPDDWASYINGLVDEWALAEKAHPESVPVLRYLSAWLRAHRPAPMDMVLVHGDFQASNLLVKDGLQAIDWEFAHVGDPREDLGWFSLFSASIAAPNLYGRDPEGFLARYRAGTGASPEAVNQATVGYFSVVAATRVYLSILQSAAAMAEGKAQGVMLTYNLNACALGNFNWLSICQSLEGAL